jgi:hypothetical protein
MILTAAAPPPPPPPNPVIQELERQILALSDKRSADLAGVSVCEDKILEIQSTHEMNMIRARATLQATQRALQRADADIQYRFDLIQQLKGGASNASKMPPANLRNFGGVPALIQPHPSMSSPIAAADPFQGVEGGGMMPVSSLPIDAVIGSVPAPSRQAPQQYDDGMVNRAVITDADRV